MNDMSIWNLALQKLGLRQRSYQSVFDGPLHNVLVDLARYSGAFEADPNGISRDELLARHGRRQMFFRILHHIKLTSQELEAVYRPALVAAATKLQSQTARGSDE